MGMSYSKNPNLPKVRAEAVKLLRSGHSTREVARHFGFAQGTIVKWNKKIHPELRQFGVIPTESSRPGRHPAELEREVVKAILKMRRSTGRGAEYIHYVLTNKEGYRVSLSSVKRTLKRNGLTKYGPRKKWHQYPPRPRPTQAGELVQVDTIHRLYGSGRLYVYTLLDVYSRWAYAAGVERIGAGPSAEFAKRAVLASPFAFKTIQSDTDPSSQEVSPPSWPPEASPTATAGSEPPTTTPISSASTGPFRKNASPAFPATSPSGTKNCPNICATTTTRGRTWA